VAAAPHLTLTCPSMKTDRIRLSVALKHLTPFMSRSTFYAGPRWSMIEELDIREGPPLTLSQVKFTRWLKTLAGNLAVGRQAVSGRLGVHAQLLSVPGQDAYAVAIRALMQSLESGELDAEQFRRGVEALHGA
jgi:hypothetical protein